MPVKPLLCGLRAWRPAGNPDWQSQSLQNVDTMYDAVEYATGWMEFWLSRAANTGDCGGRRGGGQYPNAADSTVSG